LDKGDIVGHERHGVGVVLVAGGLCQVRFLGVKGLVDAEKLTVLLSADCADQFTAEAVEECRIDSVVVRGATLWLRSDDPRLRAIALGVISASTDPWLVMTVERCLVKFPPGARSRVTRDLSEARGQRGLDPWPDAARRAATELEDRRLREEATQEARRLAKVEAELAKTVRAQIDTVGQIRLNLGRPSLSDAERSAIEKAVRARAALPIVYKNQCWKCHTPLHSTFNAWCPLCSWLVCVCGACRKPTWVDKQGRHLGPCPQEAALVSAHGAWESGGLPF
jgi:hypothetical protein